MIVAFATVSARARVAILDHVIEESYARRRRIPSQHRSRETVEAICAAAAVIIEEQGLTALTTNGVARQAGVSITSVYAYFPDKWAIVHELFERFERQRLTRLEQVFAGLATVPDWRSLMDAAWDSMVQFRIEVPAGVLLRRAISSTPRLRQIDLEGTERTVRNLAGAMLARRPDLDADHARRVAWTATVAAGALLDDVCCTITPDLARLEEGKRLTTTYLAPYMDLPPARGRSGRGGVGGQARAR